MFEVVVRLKHCDAHVKFENDATDTPNITSLCPTQFKNNFGRPKLTHENEIITFAIQGWTITPLNFQTASCYSGHFSRYDRLLDSDTL